VRSAPKRRWYQFSLKRLLIVLAIGPPVTAGIYFLVKETGVESLLILGMILWLLLIVDLFRNPTLSANGKIIWLLMMTFSCSIATILYAAVRLHGWMADDVASNARSPD
jgi:hypothetical protein